MYNISAHFDMVAKFYTIGFGDRHIAGACWGQQRYLNINLLKEQEAEKQFNEESAC